MHLTKTRDAVTMFVAYRMLLAKTRIGNQTHSVARFKTYILFTYPRSLDFSCARRIYAFLADHPP